MTIGSRMPCMREHCWHNTGHTYITAPTKTKEICCHCGLVQSHWRLRAADDPTVHGRHLPRTP